MSDGNSIETSNLDNQKFRPNKINEIKDCFVAESKERKLLSKRLSNYIASLDYFGNSLIVLPATSDSIFIASFSTVVGTLVGKISASLSLTFSLSTGHVENY